MRKIITNTFITLDGLVQAPGGPEEDPTGGFKYGGWSVNYWHEMMAKVIMDMMANLVSYELETTEAWECPKCDQHHSDRMELVIHFLKKHYR